LLSYRALVTPAADTARLRTDDDRAAAVPELKSFRPPLIINEGGFDD